MLSSFEMCAGAGGQALGLEKAGFDHQGLVEIDRHACATLRLNRPQWSVHEQDLELFSGQHLRGVDLLAGGLPCPPFSVAGKQLGKSDERNLFPAALRIIEEAKPRAVMIENVRGFLDSTFDDYRDFILICLKKMGYKAALRLLNASDFGVPQLRPRVVLVAIRNNYAEGFDWPTVGSKKAPSVGETLLDLMAKNGWPGAKSWSEKANAIAPTIVGGSKKHGGPDLGPTRARDAWALLGVDGRGIADEPPSADLQGMPRLTVRMVARLQGFPDDWDFAGKKTAAYRQVGNAFPPPVARAVADQIYQCLTAQRTYKVAI
jgi:DNA (cytosine-5)-methyltransferase 1